MARLMRIILPVVLLFSLSYVTIPEAQAGFFSEIIKLFSRGDGSDARAKFIEETRAASNAAPVLSSIPNPEGAASSSPPPDLDLVQDSSLVSPANPLGTIQDEGSLDRVFLYTVKPGDTPSSIAKSFGVTLNTILWANNLKSASMISVGDQLIILPISGVKYTVKKGDTVDSIAKKYKQDAADIVAANGLPIGADLEAGTDLIIPNGENPTEQAPSSGVSKRFASLPLLKGYFLRPIQGGRKTQGIHGNNGVDLANSCGLPIMAAADGQVLIARTTGYNGGFGEFIVIDHPNGTQTVYAHDLKIMVTPGEEVAQGQIIGLIGNTGNTRGTTGCHVHFEIHGARNPF